MQYASNISLELSHSTGGFHLKFFIGGLAYGIPLYDIIFSFSFPTKVPL